VGPGWSVSPERQARPPLQNAAFAGAAAIATGLVPEFPAEIGPLALGSGPLRSRSTVISFWSARRSSSCEGGARPPSQVMVRFIDAHRTTFGVEPICACRSPHRGNTSGRRGSAILTAGPPGPVGTSGSGSPTSRTSRPGAASSTWRSSSMCSRGALSAGGCRLRCAATWRSMPWSKRSLRSPPR